MDSPDIWVKEIDDNSQTLPSEANPFNKVNTGKNQKIHVRIRNQGNLRSFRECDLRVFLAFTDQETPAFEFPDKWYHNETGDNEGNVNVILLGIKTVPFINPNSSFEVTLEWKKIASDWGNWDFRNKKSYILAQIAPFDGLPEDVSLTNIRNNKQLTCREIIVTHLDIAQGENSIPGNKLDITVGAEIIKKSFNLNILNIDGDTLRNTKIMATKKNRFNESGKESVFFSKNSNDVWEIEEGLTPEWIEFVSPDIVDSVSSGYKNAIFPHTIKVNQEELQVKLELV